MERRPLPLIAAAMDVLTSCYAQASRPSSGANYQPTQFTKGSIPAATGGITLSAGPRVVVPGISSSLVFIAQKWLQILVKEVGSSCQDFVAPKYIPSDSILLVIG